MKIVNNISMWLSYAGVSLVWLLMLLIAGDVIMRFVFNNPISGAAELAAMIMVCLGLGMGWCAIKGRHISADIVVSHFPPRVQAIFNSVNLFVGLIIYALIAWRALLETIWEYRFKYTVSIMMPIPMFPFWGLWVMGFIILCVVLVTLLVIQIKKAVRG